MKKYLLMFIICISSFMIYTNNVYASNNNKISSLSNITNSVTSGTITYQNSTPSFNNVSYLPSDTSSYLTISFSNVTIPQYANYFTLAFNVYDLDPSITYSCNNEYLQANILEDINFSTTYADGSQAQNSGTIESSSTTYRYCNSFKSSNDNSFSLFATYYLSDNTKGYCNIIGSGQDAYLLCPIDTSLSNGDKSLNRIYFAYTTNSSNLNRVNYRYSNNINFVLDDTYIIRDKLDTIISKLDQQNSNTNAIKNNTEQIKNDIKSENTSGAEGSADNLKNNSAFQDNTGLSGVISMPLTFVNSLTNTCQPINLNIPYMDVDVTIPCMQSVITDKMPLLANLIKIIVNGFIVYRILLDIFQIVRNAKNPEDDRIEVLDL